MGPGFTPIVFTGDWRPCSEQEAELILKANGAVTRQLT